VSRRVQPWLAIAAIALLFGVFACINLAAYADPPVVIDGFQARLFNSATGEFSADILGKGGLTLGNVPAGKYASVSTFVVVRVRLSKGASALQDTRVRLVATEKGTQLFAPKNTAIRDRVILDQTAGIGPVSDDGMTHVGFWLAHTGCRSIALTATIAGTPAAKATQVLPFTCYE
jgi:hypothetical protein